MNKSLIFSVCFSTFLRGNLNVSSLSLLKWAWRGLVKSYICSHFSTFLLCLQRHLVSSAAKPLDSVQGPPSFSYLSSESGSPRAAQMQLYLRSGPLSIQRAWYLPAALQDVQLWAKIPQQFSPAGWTTLPFWGAHTQYHMTSAYLLSPLSFQFWFLNFLFTFLFVFKEIWRS